MKELGVRELQQLREQNRYWWAAMMAPLCYLAWLAVAVCAVILVFRPGAGLAVGALAALAVALVGGATRAVAVETLLRGRIGLRIPATRDAGRRQLYRASRRDGLRAVGGLVDGILSHDRSGYHS